MKDKPRTQADRTAATRATLLAAARPLFAEHGYGGVGTAEIVRAAGVTRGALYHQYADKRDLFEAVFEEVETEVTAIIAEAVVAAGATGALAALEAGVDAWLDACADPEVQRIVLVEAPSVLGWERWREIGLRYGLGMAEALLTQGIAEGVITAQPTRPLAHVLLGAIDEAALYVGRSADPEQARAEMRVTLRRLLAVVTAP